MTPTAAASAGFLYEDRERCKRTSCEESCKRAATESVRVAAPAFLGMPGALAAGASGAGAATDLLDAPNSDHVKEFFGFAAIVLGDNGVVWLRLSCTVRRIRLTSGVVSLQRVTGMLPVSRGGHWHHCFQCTS